MGLILTLITLMLPCSILAQPPVEEWVTTYNGPGNDSDEAEDIALDKDGNIYVTGYSYGDDTDQDYATIKYDKDGKEIWVKRYNGPGNGTDKAYALALDKDGNIYVTGYSYRADTGSDYTIIKYDNNGNEIWIATYNGPANGEDEAQAMAMDEDGNIYVTGHSDGIGTHRDYATIKCDKDGNLIWVARYNGPANGTDHDCTIALDKDGNVYVAGESEGIGTGADGAIIKYDKDGNEVWVARYNGPANGYDRFCAIAIDKKGNVYVAGESEGVNTGRDVIIIKYDKDGNLIWLARYNGPKNVNDGVSCIVLDKDENIYVTGHVDEKEELGILWDSLTIKYDKDGNLIWVARYNGPENLRDDTCCIAFDQYGNVYVAGASEVSDTDCDYITIKYDKNGNEIWVARYSAPGNTEEEANAIALDKEGNVYVTGGGEKSGSDYATIKYSQIVEITPMECFEVNFVKARDKKGAKRDQIMIIGSLKLAEEAMPFDPEIDVVTVAIDGKQITIPAGSFEEKNIWRLHYYRFKGDVDDVGRVHMHLDFDKCRWWMKIRGKDTSDLVESDGGTVELSIGTNVGEDSFEWTRKCKTRWAGFAKFIEWPPIRCCTIWP